MKSSARPWMHINDTDTDTMAKHQPVERYENSEIPRIIDSEILHIKGFARYLNRQE